MPEQSEPTPDYAGLTPDTLLGAVESLGFRTSGQLLALNSYENRVYQVGLEDGPAVVSKFYRPGRWSTGAVLEEHAFSRELADAELPVVAPLADASGDTLHTYDGYRFALYPRQGGRWPELDSPGFRTRMGRLLARIHAVGALRPFTHRPVLDITRLGTTSSRYLLENGFLPHHIETAYRTLVEDLLRQVQRGFDAAGHYRNIRLHGDCHPGNILWTDDGPHFVDLDDCCTGPAVQDLWMLLSGDRGEMRGQLAALLEGYEEFNDLDYRELHLIEPLRTLRMIHYAAWLGRRWHDPAFPLAFPWFNTTRYWEDHVLALREQAALLEESPLAV
jgi:Ser/Thr protein kinase RdoA (MazF antagonist)